MFSIGCLLTGHDDMMVREVGRMWLRCQRCGRDTPGWCLEGSLAVARSSTWRTSHRTSTIFPDAKRTALVVREVCACAKI